MSPMNNRRMTPMAEPGVLDFAPGAAAAYSLRNLSLSYSGPVVTVRRSTDSAEADFTASEVSDGTLAGWAGADGFVKQWWDQSGNARHATQATAAAQPQIVDSGVLVTDGGRAAVRFDGVDDSMTFDSPGGATRHVFLVFNTDLNTVVRKQFLAELRFAGVSDNAGYLFDTRGDFSGDPLRLAIFDDGANDLQVLNPVIGRAIYVLKVTATQDSMRKNAVQLVSGNYSMGADYTGGSISTAAYSVDGKYQEIIIYPTDQTALRTRIEGNLAWYY